MLAKEDIELLEKMFEKSENLVPEEMERTREILENKIDIGQKNMEELKQYCRISNLENDNTGSMSILWTKKVERLCHFF